MDQQLTEQDVERIAERVVSKKVSKWVSPEHFAPVAPTEGQVPTFSAQNRYEPATPTSGGVTDADYLVGTAHADLSAEIVVGTTPGGELGGTWGSPTVDATHSGSAHHAAVTVSGTPDYITLSGQDIVRGSVDLAADVTGTLPIGNGGTGQATAQAAIDALTAVSGATNEHVLTKDTATGNAVFKAAAGGAGGHTIRRNGTDMAAETGLNFIDADAGTTTFVNDDGAGGETEVYLSLYVLLAGRAGGQTIYGGNAANENLVLGGTSHGTHTTSYISMLDDVRLVAGASIQDEGGTSRITLSTSGYSATLSAAVKVDPTVTDLSVTAGVALNLGGSLVPTVNSTYYMLQANPVVNPAAGVVANLFGLQGTPTLSPRGGTTGNNIYGLDFSGKLGLTTGQIADTESATVTAQYGLQTGVIIAAVLVGSGTRTLNITTSAGANITGLTASISGAGTTTFNITNYYGVKVAAQAYSNAEIVVTNAINLYVGDITGTSYTAANNRIVQFGTATPTTTSGLFEMRANFTAAANATPIYISEGATPTLRQLKTKDGAAIGAGDLVCVLV